MSPENFVYWLNGFFEISGSKALTEEQVQVLKDHLKLVLTKKTPNITITQSPLIDVIPCTSPNIDLSKGPVCSTITTTGVAPLTVDGGVAPLTVGPVSFRNDEEDFDLLTKAMSIYP
jgi:hypothetical protein